MTPLFFELFEMIEAEKNRDKQILLLRNNRSQNLIQFLRYVYDEDQFKFRVKKLPKYSKNDKGHPSLSYSSLNKEVRKFYVFLDIEPQRTTINDKKLETILIQMLEALPEPECEILEMMFKKRRLPHKGMTKKLIEDAFPNIFDKVEGTSTANIS